MFRKIRIVCDLVYIAKFHNCGHAKFHSLSYKMGFIKSFQKSYFHVLIDFYFAIEPDAI